MEEQQRTGALGPFPSLPSLPFFGVASPFSGVHRSHPGLALSELCPSLSALLRSAALCFCFLSVCRAWLSEQSAHSIGKHSTADSLRSRVVRERRCAAPLSHSRQLHAPLATAQRSDPEEGPECQKGERRGGREKGSRGKLATHPQSRAEQLMGVHRVYRWLSLGTSGDDCSDRRLHHTFLFATRAPHLLASPFVTSLVPADVTPQHKQLSAGPCSEADDGRHRREKSRLHRGKAIRLREQPSSASGGVADGSR